MTQPVEGPSLRPEDIETVQFGTTGLGRKGYVEAEVDAFLDRVQAELTRLLAENAELRSRLDVAESELARLGAGDATGPAVVPELVSTASAGSPPPAEAAARLLALAERTADEHTAQARADAEQLLATARSEAEQTLTQARAEAEQARSSAHEEAAAVREQAGAEAEAARAAAEERERRVLGELEAQRSALNAQVEQLQAFEREYRARLRAHLEEQLGALDTVGAERGDASADAPPS